jgi:DNA-binding NarL/FixJ family response regulator
MGSDPLRFAGFKAVLDSEPDLQLTTTSLAEIGSTPGINMVLVVGRIGQNVSRDVEMLKAVRSDLRVMVTGSAVNDETILDILVAGAKGYVDEAGPVTELVKAVRTVAAGMIWAPRRIMTVLIERCRTLGHGPVLNKSLTIREKQVLQLLTEGQPNREIGVSLGIEERTVKAHVSKLLQKAGVKNRIMLSIHALSFSLVAPKAQ